MLTVPSAVMRAARALVPHRSTRKPRWNLMLSAVHVVSSLSLAAAVVPASPQLVEYPREVPPAPPSLPHEVRDAVLKLVGLSVNGAAVAPQPPPTTSSQPTPPTTTPITIVTSWPRRCQPRLQAPDPVGARCSAGAAVRSALPSNIAARQPGPGQGASAAAAPRDTWRPC